MPGIARLSLTVAAFVFQTALLNAALPEATEPAPERTPAPVSLAGQLLVATPDMGDPRFERTVVLIVDHDPAGALGVVINRPAGERTFASLLDAVGQKGADAAGSVRIFAGGPVQPEIGFVVHTAEYRRPGTVAVTDRLSVTSNVRVLMDIAAGTGPAKTLVAFGYAGWGAGQLDQEIEAGAWATAEADPALVFDADREGLWEEAWKRRTQRL